MDRVGDHLLPLIAASLVLASCASDTEPSGTSPAESPPSAPSRYETLEAIANDIGCTDLQNVGTGNNPGLREFGVCQLGPHNIDIYLISDPSWNYLADEFDAVSGPGWIVVCPTGEKAANLVHAEIGGTLS